MDTVWDDLGHKAVSKEEKEKAKKEYRRLMNHFKVKQSKPKTERQVVIEEGRF